MVKAALEMRAKQHLALTPRLQQSVKLLQLSATEFAQEMQEALASNPFLEEVEQEGTQAETARVGEAPASTDLDGASADHTPIDEAPLETTTSAIETDATLAASEEFPPLKPTQRLPRRKNFRPTSAPTTATVAPTTAMVKTATSANGCTPCRPCASTCIRSCAATACRTAIACWRRP